MDTRSICAFESRQICKIGGKPWQCGNDAAFALADKIGQANVRCDPRGQDRYGRTLAVCWLGDEDLNDWLVRNGWALAYRQYSTDNVPAEDEAREAKRGIWRSEFIPPWEWRKHERQRHTGTRGGSKTRIYTHTSVYPLVGAR